MAFPFPETHRDAVKRALLGAFGTIELDAAAPMSGGLSGAALYRIRVGGIAYVLRIEAPAHAFGDPARGYVCMRAAAEAFLAPRVRYADAADGVAIMDLVPQYSLALDYPGDGGPLIVELAQATRVLHRTPAFPPLVDYMDGIRALIAQHRASGILDTGVTGDLFAAFAELTVAYRTRDADRVSSHNDLNPGNILYDGARLWLVDWESAFLADRYVDLATLANWFARDAAGEDLLLRTYFGAEPTADQRARLYLMRQVNHVFYGIVMLNGAAAERPGARLADRDLSGPGLAELGERLAMGDFGLQAWDDRVTYAKARLAAALAGLRAPAFTAAAADLAA